MAGVSWQTARVGSSYDVLAPDGSEIRLLVQVRRGSLVHCTLRPGQVSRAVRHRSVEEMWFCTAGRGQLWRGSADAEDVADLEPGVAISIPLGAAFQFRATGDAPLELIITTMPPWPGEDEAVPANGRWEATT
jgi:mannose-6-phosphate isomerase-like protein (cupin superfamily)